MREGKTGPGRDVLEIRAGACMRSVSLSLVVSPQPMSEMQKPRSTDVRLR